MSGMSGLSAVVLAAILAALVAGRTEYLGPCKVGAVRPCSESTAVPDLEWPACVHTVFFPTEIDSTFRPGSLAFNVCGKEHDRSADLYTGCQGSSGVFNKSEVFTHAVNFLNTGYAEKEQVHYVCYLETAAKDNARPTALFCLCSSKWKEGCNNDPPSRGTSKMWEVGFEHKTLHNLPGVMKPVEAKFFGPLYPITNGSAEEGPGAVCPVPTLTLQPQDCNESPLKAEFITYVRGAFEQQLKLTAGNRGCDYTGAWTWTLHGNITAKFSGMQVRFQLSLAGSSSFLSGNGWGWTFLRREGAMTQILFPCNGLLPAKTKSLVLKFAVAGKELLIPFMGTAVPFKPSGDLVFTCTAPAPRRPLLGNGAGPAPECASLLLSLAFVLST